uniref:Cilia- and flagella-associated protein 45 n=1 Tax=Macrostomum lignano TaxID=282301 RepID=A0A1I8FQR8_9PLAT
VSRRRYSALSSQNAPAFGTAAAADERGASAGGSGGAESRGAGTHDTAGGAASCGALNAAATERLRRQQHRKNLGANSILARSWDGLAEIRVTKDRSSGMDCLQSGQVAHEEDHNNGDQHQRRSSSLLQRSVQLASVARAATGAGRRRRIDHREPLTDRLSLAERRSDSPGTAACHRRRQMTATELATSEGVGLSRVGRAEAAAAMAKAVMLTSQLDLHWIFENPTGPKSPNTQVSMMSSITVGTRQSRMTKKSASARFSRKHIRGRTHLRSSQHRGYHKSVHQQDAHFEDGWPQFVSNLRDVLGIRHAVVVQVVAVDAVSAGDRKQQIRKEQNPTRDAVKQRSVPILRWSPGPAAALPDHLPALHSRRESVRRAPSVTQRKDHQKQQQASGGDAIEREAAQRASPSSASERQPPRERVQVVTKDLIRDLIVPHEDPSGNSLVLPFSDRFSTEEEREAQHQAAKEARGGGAGDAVMQRKNKFKQLDVSRKKSEKLTDLEEEAKEKAEHLLQKAMLQRRDQAAQRAHSQCQMPPPSATLRFSSARRWARTAATEEVRLDEMMEIDRRNAIRIQEEIEKKRRENEMVGASKIVEQIHENEQDKLLELERKDQENVAMAKYLERLNGGREAEQDRLREELNKANEEIMKRREVVKVQEKALEEKVLQFQRDKAEREAAYEAEQERIKAEKEKEVARLRAMQERASDEQAERDALRAKRAAEAAERERPGRSACPEAATSWSAQAARERAEFERKELIEKDKARRWPDHDVRREKYNEKSRRQIQQKDARKDPVERNAFFEEAVKTV